VNSEPAMKKKKTRFKEGSVQNSRLVSRDMRKSQVGPFTKYLLEYRVPPLHLYFSPRAPHLQHPISTRTQIERAFKIRVRRLVQKDEDKKKNATSPPRSRKPLTAACGYPWQTARLVSCDLSDSHIVPYQERRRAPVCLANGRSQARSSGRTPQGK